mgnify:CR=1 FL=1
MYINRRSFIGAGAVAGAAVLIPLRVGATANAAKPVPNVLTPFTEQLPTLANLGVIDATTTPAATISMVNASHSIPLPMSSTPTFTYLAAGGTPNYPAPVTAANTTVPFSHTLPNNRSSPRLATPIKTPLL